MRIQQLIRYNLELQLYTKLYHGHEKNTVFFSGKEGIKHEVAFVLKKEVMFLTSKMHIKGYVY